MRRRNFIKGIVGSAAAWPLAARAQQAVQMRRIGVLMGYAENDPSARSLLTAFQGALQKLGWIEERNIKIERRWAAGQSNRITTFAKELVTLQPDVILAQNTPVVTALLKETRTIPIVFVVVSDPIGSGIVASLARPGGNFTGFTNVESTMGGKWVELLKEIAPSVTRVALLFNPNTAAPIDFHMPSIEAAASAHAIKLSTSAVHNLAEVEAAIVSQSTQPNGGLIVMPDAFNTTNRELIVSLAARHQIPSVYSTRAHVVSGGLMSYGIDLTEQFRQAATYVDRVLKGAKPADLPVQLPTKFELVINLKTAKAIGLTIPPLMLTRADEVIE